MSRVYRRQDRKDAYYWIEFRDERGAKRRERISPNRRHAEEILNRRLTEVAERKYLSRRETGRLRFSEFAKDYIDKIVPTLRWADQAARIVGYWMAYFGDRRLAEITAAEIEQYRVQRLSRPKRTKSKVPQIQPSTVNREIAVLKRMFNIARSWELIENNPVTKLRMLPERNRRLRYLSEDEARRLVAVAVPHLRPLLIVALNTGARRGELFGLRWCDVDLDARVLSFVSTKNNRRRDIVVNTAVCDTLRRLPRKGEFVFSPAGTRISSVVHAFQTALKRAGIENFRFHDLRHTFASHAVMSGMDIPTLQQILGHATPTMTMRYSHLTPAHAMKAVERVDLGRQKGGDAVRDRSNTYAVSDRLNRVRRAEPDGRRALSLVQVGQNHQ